MTIDEDQIGTVRRAYRAGLKVRNQSRTGAAQPNGVTVNLRTQLGAAPPASCYQNYQRVTTAPTVQKHGRQRRG